MQKLRHSSAQANFSEQMEDAPEVAGVRVLASTLPGADRDTLRQMSDLFRQKFD